MTSFALYIHYRGKLLAALPYCFLHYFDFLFRNQFPLNAATINLATGVFRRFRIRRATARKALSQIPSRKKYLGLPVLVRP